MSVLWASCPKVRELRYQVQFATFAVITSASGQHYDGESACGEPAEPIPARPLQNPEGIQD